MKYSIVLCGVLIAGNVGFPGRNTENIGKIEIFDTSSIETSDICAIVFDDDLMVGRGEVGRCGARLYVILFLTRLYSHSLT